MLHWDLALWGFMEHKAGCWPTEYTQACSLANEQTGMCLPKIHSFSFTNPQRSILQTILAASGWLWTAKTPTILVKSPGNLHRQIAQCVFRKAAAMRFLGYFCLIMSFQSHQPLGKPDNLLILNPTDIQTPDIRFHLYQSN